MPNKEDVMETAHFGVFEPAPGAAPAGANGQKPFFSDARMRKDERQIAILSGKLPLHEQEHDRRDELSLANWLALMNL